MRVSVVFLLVAFCNASHNACQSVQSGFMKTKDNGMLQYKRQQHRLKMSLTVTLFINDFAKFLRF